MSSLAGVSSRIRGPKHEMTRSLERKHQLSSVLAVYGWTSGESGGRMLVHSELSCLFDVQKTWMITVFHRIHV
eukprot:5709155-Pleurochrysis_carterae.AAC.1